MSNFFAGIRHTNDALGTARYGLQITGRNIANADTPGYTRQAAGQSEISPAVGVSRLHVGRTDDGGVRSLGAERLNDPVVDRRARLEHARSADVDTKASRLSDLENIFHEPSDNGLSEQLHDFWNSWGDVANDPGNKVPRQMLISSAKATVTKLHQMNASLDSVATAASESLEAQVSDVNSAAKELAELNRKIAIANPVDADGNPVGGSVDAATHASANALLDRRDVLLDKLSSAVGASATIETNGTATVTVGGHMLVEGGTPPNATAGSLVIKHADLNDPTSQVTITMKAADASPSDPPVDLVKPDPSNPINLLTDSTIAAEAHALNDTVPEYRGKLDDVAQALAGQVNAIQGGHTNAGASDPIPAMDKGYDLNGDDGVAMFDDGSSGTSDITAANISLTTDFTGANAYQKVAAASTQTTGGNEDGTNALNAADAGNADYSPDAAYSSLVGELGRASASAQNQQATQKVITNSIDSLQSQSSGVSFDEEVSNMLTYQRAYQASARVLTTMDDMLDTLINRTGMVGR